MSREDFWTDFSEDLRIRESSVCSSPLVPIPPIYMQLVERQIVELVQISVNHKRLNLAYIILKHDFVRMSSMSLCGSKSLIYLPEPHWS